MRKFLKKFFAIFILVLMFCFNIDVKADMIKDGAVVIDQIDWSY